MRIAVIDDERPSRSELIHQLRLLQPKAQILEAASGAQAVELLSGEPLDILFIDIHLGDMEGTALATIARRLMPQAYLVFATAYSEYAVKAFELNMDNYILKPFDPQRLAQVLEDWEKRDLSRAAASVMRIAVNCDRRILLLDADDILYVETDGSGRGCLIHTAGKIYNDSVTLGEYERRLAAQGFFRIHKSYLVNLKYIRDIFPWNNSSFSLHMRNCEETLPISRERIRALRQILNC